MTNHVKNHTFMKVESYLV